MTVHCSLQFLLLRSFLLSFQQQKQQFWLKAEKYKKVKNFCSFLKQFSLARDLLVVIQGVNEIRTLIFFGKKKMSNWSAICIALLKCKQTFTDFFRLLWFLTIFSNFYPELVGTPCSSRPASWQLNLARHKFSFSKKFIFLTKKGDSPCCGPNDMFSCEIQIFLGSLQGIGMFPTQPTSLPKSIWWQERWHT